MQVSRTTVRAAVKAIEEEGLVRLADNRRRIVVGTRIRSDSLLADTIAIITHLGEAWPAGVQPSAVTGWERYIQTGLIDAIRAAGLHALTLRFDRLQGDSIKKLLSDQPHGLVLMRPTLLSPEVLTAARQLHQSGVPVLSYGYSPGLEFDCVTSDHAAGCQELCDWLIQKGNKRLLRVWDTPIGSEIPEWRKQRDIGYETAVRAAGLESIPALQTPFIPEATIQSREDFELRARLILGFLWEHISGPNPVDAILALTDGICYPIAAALRMLGKQPNRDIQIVGYDNYWQDSPYRQWETTGPAATIDKLNLDLGHELMTMLLDRANGKLPPEPQLRLVKPKLRVIEDVSASTAA